ncbi:Serine/threonine-protein kinase svkA [Stylophora pistillata]|uniref:Serine/threonine-protein kinase svkA n=1 Tax=Stylophora pistillata TaxID=50429 RepID=A0A2B4RJX7_STYPI|nr:Serine/threonine-protein kinase svkA [Stylophora pistillata]
MSADLEASTKLEIPNKREVKSRKNTPEEKRKQNREWRKRKRQQKKAGNLALLANTEVLPGINAGPNVAKTNLIDKKSLSPNLDTEQISNNASEGAWRRRKTQADSIYSRPFLAQTTFKRIGSQKNIQLKSISDKEFNGNFKELIPEHLVYLTQHSVGSGSFGQCFKASYRGIAVIVKQMKHNDNAEEQYRAKKNLLHEAGVITTLGDHANLPMLFGVVTKSLPLCLVLQFHGINQESTTLHQAASKNLLKPTDCISLFIEIASTLSYVHSKGYLHNDIKANNVVLGRKSDSAKYDPILIDFGKSTMLGLPSSKRSSFYCSRETYLAPEVQKERLYSIASDIYSLGRMLKVVSCLIGFYEKVLVVVKKATEENPGDRPTVEEFLQQISTIIL